MKPQLGDTISNRYVLVSPLREETGMQVWKASDHVLSRDCQLFIVNNRKALYEANATASMLAISHDSHFTKVLQLQHDNEVAIIITQLDSGMSLSEYLSAFLTHPLSYEAMRSIIGEVLEALHVLHKDNITHHCISTDTVRITRTGVEIADAPVSIMLADPSHMASEGFEQLAIRQIAALLYSMLTRQPSSPSTVFNLNALPQDTPMEFRVICKRGLNLQEDGGFPTIEMATIAELEALLDEHKPLTSLSSVDVALPTMDSECSIVSAPVLQVSEQDTIEIPDTLAVPGSIPQMSFQPPAPHSDFSDSKDALVKGVSATGGAVKSLWNSGRELLSEEDIDGVAEDDSTFSFPIKVSVPSDDAPVEESQLEKTGRIPVIGPDGRVIQPGEESARALQAEQEAIEAAYRAGNAFTPPSFTPKNGERKGPEVANATLFGGIKTKVVAIIVAVIIVAAALGLAIHGLSHKDPSIKSSSSNGPWPEMNLEEVPFGENSSANSTSSDTKNESETSDTSSSDGSSSDESDKSTTETEDSSKTDDGAKASEKKTERTVITADKNVKSVPDPKTPENTTAYEIDNRQFLTSPNGQQGFGYYVHLTQPQKAYRMVITIRSSGGQGYVRVNTSNDPTQGEQVAQFVFDESGTTDVKFDKAVETQDIMLWVPMDSLPNNQLYIDSIQIF